MSFSEGVTQMNCSVGVVLERTSEDARTLVLQSQLVDGVSEGDFDDPNVLSFWTEREAIDTDTLPDLPILEVLYEQLARKVEELSPESVIMRGLSRNVSIHSLKRDHVIPSPEVIWSRLKTGSLFHNHVIRTHRGPDPDNPRDLGGWKENVYWCVSPFTLGPQALAEAIATAQEMGTERLKGHISALEDKEADLSHSQEVINDPTEGVFLFDGAKISENRWGKWIVVPDRTVVSKRHGVQVLQVLGRPFRYNTDNLYGHELFLKDGSGKYFVPHFYPFDEVDDRGIPIDRDRERVAIEIHIGNPVRTTKRALAEEKVVLDTVFGRFFAKANQGLLAGAQGFGGAHFLDFHCTEITDTPYERTGDIGNLSQEQRASQLVVPIDQLEALREMKVLLPGF